MKNTLIKSQACWLIGMVIILLAVSSCTEIESLFEPLAADETGITFSNNIIENDTLNIINYANMYNGGGVGIADFNNDGLQDIYLTALMDDNELYLNQGEFRFKNVTEEANVAAAEIWSSGVAVVDINSDGLMDIFVCATSHDEAERRTTLLYINQGVDDNNIPVFKEMAADYNIAFSGHTTMGAFFDYDNDGDLDLYLMVNQFNRFDSMIRRDGRMPAEILETRDRLFRNEGADSLGHPWFRDVSDEAGIIKEGFGLGVNITDINNDGWKDIYVANDFYTSDLLYVNNGNGTFTDQSRQIFKHTAYAAMGSDIADINNDGYSDVVVLDMRPEGNYRKKKMLRPVGQSATLSSKRYNSDNRTQGNNRDYYIRDQKNAFEDQFERNVLQIYQGREPETGKAVYSEIGISSEISETDWSWAPLLSDFDNDGWRDLIVTNGFPKELTDNDFEEYLNLYPQNISLEELLDKLSSVKINNYIYRNKGDSGKRRGEGGLSFENVTERWGMDIPSFSYGVAQVDLNNDGALDLVVNNINEPAFIFKNLLAELHPGNNNYLRINLEGTGNNTMGLGTLLEIEYGNGKKQFHEFTTYRGYQSSVEPFIHFGLGDSVSVDKLAVTWPDSTVQVIRDIEPNQVIRVHQKDAVEMKKEEGQQLTEEELLFENITGESGIDYVHREWNYNDYNVQPLLPHKLTQYGPGLSVGDVNSDGRDDIYISGSFEYKGDFFIQQFDGTFEREDLLVGNNPNNREEELGSLFFDADGDGDDDLYIVSGSYEHSLGDRAYQDRLFINEGGRYSLAGDALPQFLSSGSAVRAADFDQDGDLDLFVGGRVKPHRYPEPVDSYILENVTENGKVRFEIANDKLAPALKEIGMISDALWTDFNNDGWVDLVLAGEWMPLRFLKNDSGSFTDVTDQTGTVNYKGWWNSLCAGDFDRDGDTDYIAGNLGTNSYFQASDKHPVRIYANDFDNNGMFDAIPSVYYKDRDGEKVEVPYHGRDNLSQQIPAIEKEFETYHDFALAMMEDILSEFETAGMLTYRANHMKSSYIENRGDGTFTVTPLPDKAQWAPIYGCVATDINNDGQSDVVLTGNEHGTDISANRYDAYNGLVLTGNGDGTFEVMGFEESGFFVPGDAKALVKLRGVDDSPLIAASQNRGPLKLFQTTQTSKIYQADDMDQSAVIHYEDGSSRKFEFYYGSSFLSSSGRFIPVNEQVRSLEVTYFEGETRTVSFSKDFASD